MTVRAHMGMPPASFTTFQCYLVGISAGFDSNCRSTYTGNGISDPGIQEPRRLQCIFQDDPFPNIWLRAFALWKTLVR